MNTENTENIETSEVLYTIDHEWEIRIWSETKDTGLIAFNADEVRLKAKLARIRMIDLYKKYEILLKDEFYKHGIFFIIKEDLDVKSIILSDINDTRHSAAVKTEYNIVSESVWTLDDIYQKINKILKFIPDGTVHTVDVGEKCLAEIGRLIQESKTTTTKTDLSIVNPKGLDTTGREIALGDLVMLFNGDGDPSQDKKWSIEKVVMDAQLCEMVCVFPKYMQDIITPIKKVKPEWLVVIKHNENLVFNNSKFGFGYKDKDGNIYEGQE